MATAKELHELTVEDLNRRARRAARDAVPGPAEAADRRAGQPRRADRRTAATWRGSSPCSARSKAAAKQPKASEKRAKAKRPWPRPRRPERRPTQRPSSRRGRPKTRIGIVTSQQDAEDGGRHRRSAALRTRKYGKILTLREKYKAHVEDHDYPKKITHQRGRQGAHRRDPARRRRTSAGAWSKVLEKRRPTREPTGRQRRLHDSDDQRARRRRQLRRQEGVLHQGARRLASASTPRIGDVIVVSIREALPNAKVKKGDVAKAVIVRTKREVGRAGRQLHQVRRQLARCSSTRTSSRSGPASSGRSPASSAPGSS